jgi:tRNA nucleotidyltransferase (CCA-adding enzyme)
MMNNIRIFEVGGSIRNELMGLKPKDRDFSVIAPDYESMRKYLIDNHAEIYQERPQFVSIKAKLPPLGAVDFTLARKESFYTDARHPDSVSPATCIEEDLSRRDFRFNAIAREVGSENLIDPFDGQYDIIKRRIHTVGFAKDRFTEDRLRIFRAIRFSCQLNFDISFEIHEAIDNFKNINNFESVTKEMIQVELCKSFTSNWRKSLEILNLHPFLFDLIENKEIWLKPTLELK